MNAKEAAAALNGNQYREEGSRELFDQMRQAGLVAAFGASDDLIELRGAINDEAGAGENSTASLNSAGLLTSDCDCADCPYFKKIEDASPFIETMWDVDGFSWRYMLTRADGSPIPHEKFVIMEDDEPYCEGIVFATDDLL